MENLNNPAKRILNLVNQVRSKHDTLATSIVWGEVFGLDSAVLKDDPHQVYEKLILVRKEVELVESLMQKTTFSKNLYQPYLTRVKNTISVANISTTWNNYKPNLSADTVLSIMFCSEILSDEESIDKEELESILSSVKTLKQEIEASSISPEMRNFLISQLNIIENAIQNYPITGGVAIKNAFSQGFTDLASNADNIAKSTLDDYEEASKVANLWKFLKTIGKGVTETDRMANALVGLYEKGHKASDTVINLLSGPQ